MGTKDAVKGTGKGAAGGIPQTIPEPKGAAVICPTCRTENLSDSRFCAQCATPLKESATKTIKTPTFEISRGDLFASRYEIVEELGQGGMGKVFKAYDRKVNEMIALKLIRPEISVNEKAIERFKNELKVARKITHRNICRMHDLGEEGFFHYITMEYVAGEDLKRFIRRAGTLSSGKAIYIAKQIGEGLAEAHQLGVIHRDLKPQNVMVDQDGNAKIMDFGIARFVDTERMTGSGVMIGTPEYMSPEQAELREVDKRADIYALGVILYEMVTGQVPFGGETPLSIALKHKTEKARNVREINAQVSAALAAVISKCMEKAPEARYQKAEELLADLSKAERDLSTAERVIPSKKRVSAGGIAPASWTKKLAAFAAVIVVLGALVLAVLKFLPKDRDISGDSSVRTDAGSVQATEPGTRTDTAGKATDSAASKQDNRRTAASSEKKKPETKENKPRQKESRTAEAVKKDESQAPAEQLKPRPVASDMSSVNLALARAGAYKSQAQEKGFDEKSLFFRLAEAKRQEGQKHAAQSAVVEARSLFAVAEKGFRICLEEDKDKDRLKALRKYVEGLRESVRQQSSFSPEDKLYVSAEEKEKQAAGFQENNDLENAASFYLQSSVLYQRILLALPPAKR